MYGKEEVTPIDAMIAHEDMPHPKEVFWTDHGHSPPVCPAKPEISTNPPGIQKGNQKPYRITEIGLSGSTLQKIDDESVYWRLDKPIIIWERV